MHKSLHKAPNRELDEPHRQHNNKIQSERRLQLDPFNRVNLNIPQNIQILQRQIDKDLGYHRHRICNSGSNHQPIVTRQRSEYVQSREYSQADKAHPHTVEDTPCRKLPWQGCLQVIVHCLSQTFNCALIDCFLTCAWGWVRLSGSASSDVNETIAVVILDATVDAKLRYTVIGCWRCVKPSSPQFRDFSISTDLDYRTTTETLPLRNSLRSERRPISSARTSTRPETTPDWLFLLTPS